MAANDRQVGGSHYKGKLEHWDYVWSNGLDYFQGQITKYVARWKKKSGLQDLYKAKHFLEKYIELVEAEEKAKDAAKFTNTAGGLLSPGPRENPLAGGKLLAGCAAQEASNQTSAFQRGGLSGSDVDAILRDGWRNM